MGIDWFPCRVEPGIPREEIDRLVQLEARMFLAVGGNLCSDLQRLVKFTETQRVEIDRAYSVAGRLKDRLLFKWTSHRVYVITYEELFPLEWRLDAYRTIPPWELPGQVETWQAHRVQVAQGGHRAYLLQLQMYLRSNAFSDYFRDTLIGAAERARAATSNWGRQPDFCALRDRILASPCPEVLPPPVWEELRFHSLTHLPAKDEQLQQLRGTQDHLAELAKTWNAVVQRGNRHVELPPPVPDLEEWIACCLADGWYARFLAWLEPWVRGGYGLYRDNE
jgi:hypothetical protein